MLGAARLRYFTSRHYAALDRWRADCRGREAPVSTWSDDLWQLASEQGPVGGDGLPSLERPTSLALISQSSWMQWTCAGPIDV